jgi:flagella basal body P-ring formation protein FlgA
MSFVLGLVLQLLFSVRPLGALDIYLNRVVHLAEAEFSLGEVATVVGAEPREQQLLEALSLGSTPAHLTLLPVRVVRGQVEAGLAGRAVFIGDRAGLIPRTAVPEAEDWFYEQLLRDLDSYLVRKEGRVEIELLTRPPVSGLASGPVLFELTGAQASLDYPAGALQVRYRPQTAPGQAGSFRVLLHHFLPVAKAARDLKVGTLLTNADLEFQELDLAVQPGSYLTAGDLDAPYRVYLTARQGSFIRRSQVSRVMAVQAGEEVKLSFLSQGLLVCLPGTAVSSGGVGEFVQVRVAGSPRRYTGRISAPKEVLVELP